MDQIDDFAASSWIVRQTPRDPACRDDLLPIKNQQAFLGVI